MLELSSVSSAGGMETKTTSRATTSTTKTKSGRTIIIMAPLLSSTVKKPPVAPPPPLPPPPLSTCPNNTITTSTTTTTSIGYCGRMCSTIVSRRKRLWFHHYHHQHYSLLLPLSRYIVPSTKTKSLFLLLASSSSSIIVLFVVIRSMFLLTITIQLLFLILLLFSLPILRIIMLTVVPPTTSLPISLISTVFISIYQSTLFCSKFLLLRLLLMFMLLNASYLHYSYTLFLLITYYCSLFLSSKSSSSTLLLCWLTRLSSLLYSYFIKSTLSSILSCRVVHVSDNNKVLLVGGECDPHHRHMITPNDSNIIIAKSHGVRSNRKGFTNQQSQLSPCCNRRLQQNNRHYHNHNLYQHHNHNHHHYRLNNHRHYRSRCHHPFLPSCLTFLFSLRSSLMSSSTSSSTSTTSSTSTSISSCQPHLFATTSFSTSNHHNHNNYHHNFHLHLIILFLITTFASKVCCSSSSSSSGSDSSSSSGSANSGDGGGGSTINNKIVVVDTNHYNDSNNNNKNPFVEDQYICGNIDIRNSVKQFSKLENCTVVEGHVKIVLIDNGVPKDYENITFPKLREITDYLLLFRAFGLQSLAKLFPNLSVIRGRRLLHNYAFVVYEMLNLQEIGLYNLTNVLRGDIRIEKNPNLCFTDTIDWSRIAKNHLIANNKDSNRCSTCPDECKVGGPKYNSDGTTIGDINGRFCWTSTVCQKDFCPLDCERQNGTCTTKGECCFDQCIGGCTITSYKPALNQTCAVCKNFIYNNRCYESCPPNTFEYYGRRCFTAEQCHRLSIVNADNPIIYKAFNGKCDYKCPVGYDEDPTNKSSCFYCGATCPKVCQSMQVSNIASAQSLKYCTKIQGNLEIYISSGGAQIVQELENNLKDIKEITGYLKIARSFPIITLDFLRNLEVIGGEKLERNSSLLVLDNPNLQDLWTFDNNTQQRQLQTGRKRIQILKGRIFFHVNPKLCYQKIKSMTDYMDIVQMNDTWELSDVSPSTNGDRVTCSVHKLYVVIWGVGPQLVGIRFENFKPKMKDPRHLLAYLIYLRETDNRNVTIYDGRDACSDNSWTVIDYDAPEYDSTNFTDELLMSIVPDLKPYTLYAMYIKTYIITPDENGAQSDIMYFKTEPDTPSQPRNLIAKAIKHNEVFVSWDSPAKPNGEVTHYIVRATRDLNVITNRHYCDSNYKDYTKENRVKPHKVAPPLHTATLPGSNKTDLDRNGGGGVFSGKANSQQKHCCTCKNEKIRPTDVEQSINFEDSLINDVYIKREETPPSNETFDKSLLPSDSNKIGRKRRNILEKESEEELIYERISLNNLSTSTTTTNVPISSSTLSPYELTTFSSGTSVLSRLNDASDTQLEHNNNHHHNSNDSQTIEKWQLNKTVYSLNDVLTDLHHFTEYTIEIRACQNSSIKEPCSMASITSIRTLPLATADDIDEDSIVGTIGNVTSESKQTPLFIKWDEPISPNGFVLFYQIEIKQITNRPMKQSSTTTTCIQLKDYQDQKGHMFELSPGNYSVRIRAKSLSEFGNWTQPKYFLIEEPSLGHIYIPLVSAFIVILALVILLLFFLYRLKLNRSKLDYVSVNPDYMSAGLAYEPDPKWEVCRDKISLLCELGQGSFGMVYEGELSRNKEMIRCAIKTVNDGATIRERIDFLKEADIMKSFTDCNHVVKLLGIVSTSQPVYVLMEIMPRGDLRKYLRDNRPNNEENPFAQPPTIDQLYKMAIEISDGMAYLASKKFVHRDLAARNCMVADDLTVKIGDFGMTRDICETDYYRKGGKGLLPVRWMSPESLKDGIFTTYSDVWSFGVVLWEMCTLASQPYQGLSNEEVLKFVIDGGHMSEPADCPHVLWDMITQCWQRKPKSRPNFIKIIEQLLNHIDDKQSFLCISYYNRWKMEPSGSAEAAAAVGGSTANANAGAASAGASLTQSRLLDSDNESEYRSESSGEDSDNDDDDQLGEEDMDVQFFPLSRLGGTSSFKIFMGDENDTSVDNGNNNSGVVASAIDVEHPHGDDHNPSTSNITSDINGGGGGSNCDQPEVTNHHSSSPIMMLVNGNDDNVAYPLFNHRQSPNHLHSKPPHPHNNHNEDNNTMYNNSLPNKFSTQSLSKNIGGGGGGISGSSGSCGSRPSKSASLVSNSLSSFSSSSVAVNEKNGNDRHNHSEDEEEEDVEGGGEVKGLLNYPTIVGLKSVAAAVNLNKTATTPTTTTTTANNVVVANNNKNRNNNNNNNNNNSMINGHMMNTSIV